MTGPATAPEPAAGVSPAFLTAARAALGDGHILTDPATLELCSVDFSEIRLARAAAVARPGSVEDVQALVRLANEHNVPLVPRGASMSYTLGAVPARPGSVVVDMCRMNRILRIDTDDLCILVEPGVTWAQIYEALADSEYAIPFIGTFSGIRATVGGGLGNFAVGWGRGDIAEYLLGIEVVLGDGRILHTGALAANFEHPGLPCFGPELTRLFVHDAGAFGIKTKACFRLARKPRGIAFASFGFAREDDALGFLMEVARSGIATECFVFSEYHHGVFMNQPRPPPAEMRALLKRVVRNSASFPNACRNLLSLVRTGRLRFLADWPYSVHLAADGPSQAAADASMKVLVRAARTFNATRLPGGFLVAVRARPFGPIDDLIVGREGESCFPSNCTVALSQAMDLKHALDRFFNENAAYMRDHGLTYTRLYIAIRNTFGVEPIIYWKDRMNPLRMSILNDERREKFGNQPENAAAREAAVALRRRMVTEVFSRFRPCHVQVGKYYPLRERLEGTPAWEMLESVKNVVDPGRLINPGALGLD